MRVQRISFLGVTLTYNLTMTRHIDNIIFYWMCTFYAVRTLRSHGMPPPSLHIVFQSTVLAKDMLLQPGGVSLTPRIGIAHLSAEQLSMVTEQTLHQ